MARLTAKKRRSMPKRDFAGKGKTFPTFDRKHARMAIGGATRSYHAGNITRAEKDSIQRRARAKLRKSGSRSRRR